MLFNLYFHPTYMILRHPALVAPRLGCSDHDVGRWCRAASRGRACVAKLLEASAPQDRSRGATAASSAVGAAAAKLTSSWAAACEK